jgi:hypothetical protein
MKLGSQEDGRQVRVRLEENQNKTLEIMKNFDQDLKEFRQMNVQNNQVVINYCH